MTSPATRTVYISIGNSDDHLSQAEWARYAADLHTLVSEHAEEIHGVWFSAPDAPYQNMCVALEITSVDENGLRDGLFDLTVEFRQNSIMWAEVPFPEFLHNPSPRPVVNVMPDPLAPGGTS